MANQGAGLDRLMVSGLKSLDYREPA